MNEWMSVSTVTSAITHLMTGLGVRERDSEYMNLVEDYLHGLHTLQDHYELPLRLAYTQIREREREREREEREGERGREEKERKRERERK